MPATVSDVRAAIAAAMENVDGLRFQYATVPSKPEVPCGIVQGPQTIEFDTSYGRGSDRMLIPIMVLVSRGDADERAQALLDSFIAGDGEASIKAAVEDDPTLGGVVLSTRVVEARSYGYVDVNETKFVGVQLITEVYA